MSFYADRIRMIEGRLKTAIAKRDRLQALIEVWGNPMFDRVHTSIKACLEATKEEAILRNDADPFITGKIVGRAEAYATILFDSDKKRMELDEANAQIQKLTKELRNLTLNPRKVRDEAPQR